jgi:hypothetical protein
MKGKIMGRFRLGLIVCALAAKLVCPSAFAQPAGELPRPKGSDQDRLKMLDSIPGDSVAFLLVGNMKDFAGKADAFVKDIIPKPLSKDFSFLKVALEDRALGETFNPSGPLAVVLLDPKDYAPRLLKKVAAGKLAAAGMKSETIEVTVNGAAPATKPAAGDAAGGEADEEISPEVAKAGLPFVFILWGKDVAKMFPGRKVEADGAMSKLTKDGEEAWALEKGGVVFVSSNRRVIQAMPPKLPALARIAGGGEDLALRSDVMWWINRPRCDELKGTAFANLFWDGARVPILSDLLFSDSHNPLAAVINWFVLTRDEVFRQGESLMGGLTMAKEGPRIEFRICCKADSAMAKALAVAQKAQGTLTAALPDKPFIFAYGIRKDLFPCPPEMTTKQVASFVESPLWGDVPMATRKGIGDLILAVHPEVTGVQHWAGAVREDGPMAVATVVHCRDAEALRKIVKDHLSAIESMLNLAMQQASTDESFKLTYAEGADAAEGEIQADVIEVSHPELDKMLADNEMGARMRAMLLKVFPGETKFRVRLAVQDKNTLLVTLGGGKKFLAEVAAAAKSNATKLELSEDAKAALALMPANRFAVAMVDIPNAVAFGSRAMMAASMGMGGAQIRIKPAPPIMVALSADKNDLVITAHVPAKLLKQLIGTLSNMGEDGMEEDEPAPAPATRPATRPAGRVGAAGAAGAGAAGAGAAGAAPAGDVAAPAGGAPAPVGAPQGVTGTSLENHMSVTIEYAPTTEPAR